MLLPRDPNSRAAQLLFRTVYRNIQELNSLKHRQQKIEESAVGVVFELPIIRRGWSIAVNVNSSLSDVS